MSLVVPVAHDFVCPWCWIGIRQARRLTADYGVQFEWLSYELLPEGLATPPKKEPGKVDPRRPYVPTRLVLAYAAEQMDVPTAQPSGPLSTHPAHEAVEFARTKGVHAALVERIYDAYWLEGRRIDSIDVLQELASGIVPDLRGMADAVRTKRFADRIVPFDEPAYDTGVFYVPTYFIGAELFPEQTYAAIEAAVRSQIGLGPKSGIYPHLRLGRAGKARPYVVMNMVATIDGKILSGHRDEAVMDLGSDLDHATMRQIENAADAVMVGAGSLRATGGMSYPAHLLRVVVSGSGKVPTRRKFFSQAKGRAFVATTEKGAQELPDTKLAIVAGARSINMRRLLKTLRQDHGVQTLLVEGGSEMNASLLQKDLVDELFLTVAPKVKLGRDVPTYAGGDPLQRDELLNFRLISNRTAGDEIFLRYLRDRK
ncbi:MAG: dihydrofolate reductase family protein [Armatimonadetes bacterium]|nr:dihydrofolate reductase family protein [Armatimonadota bacterium]